MAEHKSQHFVPRCYLRHFSKDSEGKSICLLHIKSRRLVRVASIKGQCARPYLYGNDLQIEKALQKIEGEYASVFNNVAARPKTPCSEDLKKLRNFMVLQTARTEAAIKKTKMMFEETKGVIDKEYPGEFPELESDMHSMMHMTFSMYMDMQEYLTDLKICLVRNKTNTQFITSDDPAVFTSMFHAKKIRTDKFGFASTGALFLFPLSPKLLLLCYDGDAYNMRGKSHGAISLFNDKDVHACNELQFQNAAHAIYFQDWEQRSELDQEFNVAASRRKCFHPEISRFVPEGTGENSQLYKKLDQNEETESDDMILEMSSLRVFPSSWISQLRFRKKVRHFYDGSAAGYMRLHSRNVNRRSRVYRPDGF